MQNTKYEITTTGQLVQIRTTENVVTNPEILLEALRAVPEEQEAASVLVSAKDNEIKAFYDLGDGVCTFQRHFSGNIHTFGGVLLNHIPFYTNWELGEEAGTHFMCPNNGISEDNCFDVGAPMILPIPDDLIVHFFVEWLHNETVDILQPKAEILWQLPKLLASCTRNFYLTCFSKSRNTCVRMPLPNLYDDCHLCVGNSFRADSFNNSINHQGITTSIRHYAEAWSQTAWNLDLLEGARSNRMKQYRRFVRFDPSTGNPLEYTGCEDWPLSTSEVPLEDVYLPWTTEKKAVLPETREGEVDAPAEAPEAMPDPVLAEAVTDPVLAEEMTVPMPVEARPTPVPEMQEINIGTNAVFENAGPTPN